MKENHRKAFLLHSRLPVFHRRVAKAVEIVNRFLSMVKNSYCSVSGGKDSLVVLDMKYQIAPKINGVFWDDGWDYPETLEFHQILERRYDFKLIRIKNYADIKSFAAYMGGTALGFNNVQCDYEVKTWADHPRLIKRLGFDGVFLGLRREESVKRWFNFAVRGEIYFCKKENILIANPVANFTYQDIWAYILSNEIPYNPVYDKLSEIGVDPEFWRVGPLMGLGLDCYATIKRGWPELFDKIAAEFPQARAYI